jgi:hypothetical protein
MLHESLKVRRVGTAIDQQVCMVGEDTVREDIEAGLVGGSKKLRTNLGEKFLRIEERAVVRTTDCEEICTNTEVGTFGEPRISSSHGIRDAKPGPVDAARVAAARVAAPVRVAAGLQAGGPAPPVRIKKSC